MAEQADRVQPWTIKGIPPEARNAAIAAAARDKLTIGEWLARAIRAQVQSDRQQTRAPALAGAPAGPTDLAQVERVVAMTAQLAAAGAPPPKAVSRAAYALLRTALAGMKPPGPTRAAQGLTETAESLTKAPESPTEQPESLTETTSGLTKALAGQTEAPTGQTQHPKSQTIRPNSQTQTRRGQTP